MLWNQQMKTLVIPSENQVIPKKDDSPPFSGDFISPRTVRTSISPHPPLLSPQLSSFLFPTLNTVRAEPLMVAPPSFRLMGPVRSGSPCSPHQCGTRAILKEPRHRTNPSQGVAVEAHGAASSSSLSPWGLSSVRF